MRRRSGRGSADQASQDRSSSCVHVHLQVDLLIQSLTRTDRLQITSKLWCTHHHRVEAALNESLERLGTDYLDCASHAYEFKASLTLWYSVYLVHWPVHLNPNGNDPKFPLRPDGTRDVVLDWKLADTWKQMEAVCKKG